MKENIDVITELAKQLYDYTKGHNTLSLEQCDVVELMLNDILCNLENVRCEYYELQHECDLEHVVDLANIPDLAPENLPF